MHKLTILSWDAATNDVCYTPVMLDDAEFAAVNELGALGLSAATLALLPKPSEWLGVETQDVELDGERLLRTGINLATYAGGA